jgi:uncharacterized protein DUF5946
MALQSLSANGNRALAVQVDDGRCPGCGVVLPPAPGPHHAYFGASPTCWALFKRLSERTVPRAEALRTRRLLRDAYAAQHPGRRQLRAIQSVAVHLMDLCVVLERGGALIRQEPVLGRPALRPTLDLHWLEPPRRLGAMTARDALGPDDGPDARAERVERWAAGVWDAWAEHHATIRAWLDASAARHEMLR